jgi:Rieske Fe-S protein
LTISRRAFIKMTGTAVVCTCMGLVGTGGCTARRTSDIASAPAGSYRLEDGRVIVALPDLETLQDVGGAVKLALGAEGGSERVLILLRLGADDYRAFADRCTHNGKELDYGHEEGMLACVGRGSRYDLAGDVIRGPAEDPLLRYLVRLEGEELVVEV